MKSKALIVILTLCFLGCGAPEEKAEVIKTSHSTEYFYSLLAAKFDYFPEVELDSLSLENDDLNLYVSDRSKTYLDYVSIEQNVTIILRDFCCVSFEANPINRIRVYYQLPLRDSSQQITTGYFKFYEGNLDQTKKAVYIHSNPVITDVTREILLANQDAGNIHLLDLLNNVYALIIRKSDASKTDLSLDFMKLVQNALLECEVGESDQYKNIYNSVISIMKSDLKLKEDERVKVKILVSRIDRQFNKSCKLLSELN